MFHRYLLLLLLVCSLPRPADACMCGYEDIITCPFIAGTVAAFITQGDSIAAAVLSNKSREIAAQSSMSTDDKSKVDRSLISGTVSYSVASAFNTAAIIGTWLTVLTSGYSVKPRALATVIVSSIGTTAAVAGLISNSIAYATMADNNLADNGHMKDLLGTSISTTVLDGLGTTLLLAMFCHKM